MQKDASHYWQNVKQRQRKVERGELLRAAPGVYLPNTHEATQFHQFVLVALKKPEGIICLVSALTFHGLTDQNPQYIYVAVPQTERAPRLQAVAIATIRMSGAALHEGVEVHEIEGVPVRMFSPAKTVADCFKFRNKIGLDIALEALRNCWHGKRATMDELWHYAEVCRVANVMRPYLEMLV